MMSKEIINNKEEDRDKIIEGILNSLQNGHNISNEEVFRYLIKNKKKAERVPVSVFRAGLSPLQATVKYLIENKAYTFNEISGLLNRDQRTIWSTYKAANNKVSGHIPIGDTNYFVELSIFQNRKLSFLENLCCYLKGRYSLSYHKIAVLLGKDDRTIWTVCKRAEKKNENG